MASEGEPTAVPGYLLDLCRKLEPGALQRVMLSADSESQLIEYGLDAQAGLHAWSSDHEQWDRLSGFLQQPRAAELVGTPDQLAPRNTAPSEELNDELELHIVSRALNGDTALATTIVVEAPVFVSFTTIHVTQVQGAVEQVSSNVGDALSDANPNRRRLRLGKVLRRVFKAAAGGVLIVSDIAIPDPSLIRICSIAGGVDMILDAAGLRAG